MGKVLKRTSGDLGINSKTRTNIQINIIHTVMLIVAIVGGMMLGYMVGQYIVDRYINQNHEDIDNPKN